MVLFQLTFQNHINICQLEFLIKDIPSIALRKGIDSHFIKEPSYLGLQFLIRIEQKTLHNFLQKQILFFQYFSYIKD